MKKPYLRISIKTTVIQTEDSIAAGSFVPGDTTGPFSPTVSAWQDNNGNPTDYGDESGYSSVDL